MPANKGGRPPKDKVRAARFKGGYKKGTRAFGAFPPDSPIAELKKRLAAEEAKSSDQEEKNVLLVEQLRKGVVGVFPFHHFIC